MEKLTEPIRCPYCGQPLQVIEVHGHSQCSICKTNVAPCCSGENEQKCEVDSAK